MSVFNPAAVSCPHFLIKINWVLLSLLETVKEELTKAALSHWQMTHKDPSSSPPLDGIIDSGR